jgi:uncharacterized tellurite resistance protein B-like protein
MNHNDNRLGFEILALLLQVAWADEEIHADESEHLLELAREANLSEEEFVTLAKGLRGEGSLPAPDLGYLRAHKSEALAAAERLIALDTNIAAGESAVLNQLRELLG